MKYSFCFLLFVVFSCHSPSKEVKVENSNSTTHYAKHFRFSNVNNQDVLEIISPDTKQVVATLKPLSSNKDNIAISATIIGMLNALELAENIVGVQEIKYVYNPIVNENFKKGKIIETGYETQLAVEPIIAKKPAVILHNGLNSSFPHQKQFETVGIQCVPIFDWREESPLGKAEWIKVYGFLYGKLEQANQLFDAIVAKYNNLVDEAKHLSPSELLMSGNIIGSEWYSPSGESFYAQLFRDANITYAFSGTKGTGSIANTQEDYLIKNRHAKIWINPGVRSLKELLVLNPKANLFDAYKENNVFCYSLHDNFYWEMTSIEPDQLLEDLIWIAHPESRKNRKLRFYSHLEP
ncbi:MAG: ABC transporter substrate-binding protein [Crocinitomicaceae bacterium]|nr:ABC transporter substrate-binding protein [Crocinitomicaceae bacterium]